MIKALDVIKASLVVGGVSLAFVKAHKRYQVHKLAKRIKEGGIPALNGIYVGHPSLSEYPKDLNGEPIIPPLAGILKGNMPYYFYGTAGKAGINRMKGIIDSKFLSKYSPIGRRHI